MTRALSAFAVAGVVALSALTVGQQVVARASLDTVVGNEMPAFFAVSPLYRLTHMVVTVTAPVGGCSCPHLWVTRDAGASWRRVGNGSPPGGPIVVVVNARGGEELVTSNSSHTYASDDDGATWRVVGAPGMPGALGEQAVAVAGLGKTSDYVLSPSGTHTVSGSGGRGTDLSFAMGAADGNNPYALLASNDPQSNMPVILSCDRRLSCSGGSRLPNAGPGSSGDISLLPADDFDLSGVAYVRTEHMLYESTDAGQTFVAITAPQLPGSYSTMPSAAVGDDPAHTLYVALLTVAGSGSSQVSAGGVFASSDSGRSWHEVGQRSPLDGGASAVARTPDGRLFAGYVDAHGAAGLLCNQDGSWRATCDAPSTACAHSGCGPMPAHDGGGGSAGPNGADVVAGTDNNPSAAVQQPSTAHGDAAVALDTGGGQGGSTGGDAGGAPVGLIAGGVFAVLALLAVSIRRPARR